MILNFLIKSLAVTTDPTCWWISKISAWFKWFTSFYGMKVILIPNIYLFLFFFFRPRPTTIYTIWWSHWVVSTRASVKNVSHKRAPDLAWFSLYSLFCPLCFVSFFKFCLHPGALYTSKTEFLARNSWDSVLFQNRSSWLSCSLLNSEIWESSSFRFRRPAGAFNFSSRNWHLTLSNLEFLLLAQ